MGRQGTENRTNTPNPTTVSTVEVYPDPVGGGIQAEADGPDGGVYRAPELR
jgi:hypothetical protein